MMLFSKVARSRKHIPPNLEALLSRTVMDYFAPKLMRSLSTSGVPLPGGAGAIRHFALRPGCGASSDVKHFLAQSRLSGLGFQHHILGPGHQWLRNYKKELSWLQRRKSNYWRSGSGGSRVRHFGSGSYVDPQLALGALIATNVGVFILWRTLGGHFMQSNFVVSAEAIKQGRLHTLVTSAFSQYELHHLLSNMIGLFFFGSEIGRLFGGQRLLLLYLTGGVVGSLSHLAYWTYIKPWAEGYPRRFSRHSPGLLGSSGAVNAIVLLDILLFPTRVIYFNLIIPVPAVLFGIVIIGSDLWAATDGNRHGTSPAAHLGGALIGALAWLRWR